MTHWKIGLSNGENFLEGNIPFQIIVGEKSPWLKLQDYIKEKGLKITSLCLVYQDRTFNLPSAGNNPKFRAFSEIEKPLSYNFFRMLGSDLNGTQNDLYSVIEAVYSDKKLQLWLNERNPNSCWVLIK